MKVSPQVSSEYLCVLGRPIVLGESSTLPLASLGHLLTWIRCVRWQHLDVSCAWDALVQSIVPTISTSGVRFKSVVENAGMAL